MANSFCHVELASTDVAKSKTFYSTLFDWKISDTDMGGGMIYSTFKPSADSPGGGMMQHPVPGAPSAWLPYVLVDDINAATKKAASLGAKIMRDTQEAPHGLVQHHHRPRPAPPSAYGKPTHPPQDHKRREPSPSGHTTQPHGDVCPLPGRAQSGNSNRQPLFENGRLFSSTDTDAPPSLTKTLIILTFHLWPNGDGIAPLRCKPRCKWAQGKMEVGACHHSCKTFDTRFDFS